MSETLTMDRNLALEAVRVTEVAALAASRLMGRGDEKAADQAAVDAMRGALNVLSIDGTVVIGEGERDEAPMLYIGEKVGRGGPRIDIALDPLEGTTITAKGGANALAVMANEGGFLNAPDVGMDKIAVGGGLPAHVVDIDKDPEANLRSLAAAKNCEVGWSPYPRPTAPRRPHRRRAGHGAHHVDRRRRRVGRDRTSQPAGSIFIRFRRCAGSYGGPARHRRQMQGRLIFPMTTNGRGRRNGGLRIWTQQPS